MSAETASLTIITIARAAGFGRSSAWTVPLVADLLGIFLAAEHSMMLQGRDLVRQMVVIHIELWTWTVQARSLVWIRQGVDSVRTAGSIKTRDYILSLESRYPLP